VHLLPQTAKCEREKEEGRLRGVVPENGGGKSDFASELMQPRETSGWELQALRGVPA
jgi:hypothetical protein